MERRKIEGMGQRIQERRKYLGITQEQLAITLGRSDTKGTISKWENERASVPLADIPALCNALNCDLGYLFGEREQPTDLHKRVMEATNLSALAVDNLFRACDCPDKIDPQVVAAEADLMDWEIGRKAKFHLVQFLLEDNGPITADGSESTDSLLEALSVAIYKYMRYRKNHAVLNWDTDGELLHYSDYAEIALDIGVNKLKQAIRNAKWDVSSWED